MKHHLVAGLLAAGLLLPHFPIRVGAMQSLSPPAQALPSVTKLTDVEIRLAYESHGGCVGRCIKYYVVIRGDGAVEYHDLGGEPSTHFGNVRLRATTSLDS